jgi:hypothetical protein
MTTRGSSLDGAAAAESGAARRSAKSDGEMRDLAWHGVG